MAELISVTQNLPPTDISARKPQIRVAVVHGLFLIAEKILRWCIHPRLRARLLGLMGAKIGRNVRIYEINLINLQSGFSNLTLGDNVHIGHGCRLDLAATLNVGRNSTLAPGVTLITHTDPGSSHGSKISVIYPPFNGPITIGCDCWIGANSTILAGLDIQNEVVVAAGSVVTTDVATRCLVAGVPARKVKALPLPEN